MRRSIIRQQARITSRFHRVPWRVYKLDGAGCRELMQVLSKQEGHSGKIPAMLAAAEFLFQVTWLPDRIINMRKPLKMQSYSMEICATWSILQQHPR